jgi:pyrimidine oxygenase
VELGVFLPIANNGWIISTTSPQYKPTFELNKQVTQKAESFGFEFVLSMARWRGYGGQTAFWDYNLESLTMMAGLAAATQTIDLYATVHPTTINPYVAAKMLATIDDISGGRAGLNIATGWDKVELGSFGAWPGDEHLSNRYELAEEWLQIATTLWQEGHCNFDGNYFRMNDALSLPTPAGHIPIVNAGMSDRGLEFSAKNADISFVSVGDEEMAREFASSLREKAQAAGKAEGVKMAAVFTVVAADSDEEAHAIAEHIRAGADVDAITEYVKRTTGTGVSSDTVAEYVMKRTFQASLLIGSPQSVAEQMNNFAANGVDAILLTFPDFIDDLDYFGREILPLLQRDRAAA